MSEIPDHPPHRAPRHDPPSYLPYIFIPITLSSLGILFILWRRAAGIKRVVQHRLKTLTRRDGKIRLPGEDELPTSMPVAVLPNGVVEDGEDSDGGAERVIRL